MALKPAGLLLKLLSLMGLGLAVIAVQAADLSASRVAPAKSASRAAVAKVARTGKSKAQLRAQSKDRLNSQSKARSKAQSKAPVQASPELHSVSGVIKTSSPKLLGSTTAVPASSAWEGQAKSPQFTAALAPYTTSITQELSFRPTRESKKAISGSISLSYSQSLVDHQDGTQKASEGAIATLSGDLTEKWSLTGRLDAQQDLKDPESIDNGISDLLLVFRNQPRDLANWLTGAWSVVTVLPTSERSSKVEKLYGGLGTSYKFGMAEAVMPMGLNASLSFSGSRYVHQYETDTGGQILTQYSFKEIFGTDYTYKKVSFSLEFIHRHLLDYTGSVSENFDHTEEIGFAIQPMWKVSLGHTNAGSWLKSNMQDSNLSLVNEDDSIVYGSTELTF